MENEVALTSLLVGSRVNKTAIDQYMPSRGVQEMMCYAV